MMIKSKKYYINKAKRKWNQVLADEVRELEEQGYVRSAEDEDLWVDPETGSKIYLTDCASVTYDEVLNAEEVVGYYLWLHKDDALKDWRTNTEGIELSEQDKKVDQILEMLFA